MQVLKPFPLLSLRGGCRRAQRLTPSPQWKASMISTRDAGLADPTRHLIQSLAQETRRRLRTFNPHTRTE